ncbi:unnamed protein product [Fraxinus pennsylvanica]|uniref:Uncharacterized protein n=1 Tax=Fraxinus pennsylvanica TaxID=56036 RepID=A0AAD1ZG85_9LAMI|nr:unnamed protein product [Fraxinus pennsylvanica]
MPFATESPRWLLVRGRSQGALDVLKKYAKSHHKLPPYQSLVEPSSSAEKVAGKDSKYGNGYDYWFWTINAMMEIPAVFVGRVLLSFQSSFVLLPIGLHCRHFIFYAATSFDARRFYCFSSCLWSSESFSIVSSIWVLSIIIVMLSQCLHETGNSPLYITLKHEEEEEKFNAIDEDVGGIKLGKEVQK